MWRLFLIGFVISVLACHSISDKDFHNPVTAMTLSVVGSAMVWYAGITSLLDGAGAVRWFYALLGFAIATVLTFYIILTGIIWVIDLIFSHYFGCAREH